MVGLHRPADGFHAVLSQQGVGGADSRGLNVQTDHPAFRPGQPAEKQGVVTVAAGGVQIQPARGQHSGKQPVYQLHGSQVGHSQAAQHTVRLHKPEPPRQGERRGIGRVGQRGGKTAHGLGVESDVAAQNFLEQVAAVPLAPPPGIDGKSGEAASVQHRRPDDGLLLIQ